MPVVSLPSVIFACQILPKVVDRLSPQETERKTSPQNSKQGRPKGGAKCTNRRIRNDTRTSCGSPQ